MERRTGDGTEYTTGTWWQKLFGVDYGKADREKAREYLIKLGHSELADLIFTCNHSEKRYDCPVCHHVEQSIHAH